LGLRTDKELATISHFVNNTREWLLILSHLEKMDEEQMAIYIHQLYNVIMESPSEWQKIMNLER